MSGLGGGGGGGSGRGGLRSVTGGCGFLGSGSFRSWSGRVGRGRLRVRRGLGSRDYLVTSSRVPKGRNPEISHVSLLRMILSVDSHIPGSGRTVPFPPPIRIMDLRVIPTTTTTTGSRGITRRTGRRRIIRLSLPVVRVDGPVVSPLWGRELSVGAGRVARLTLMSPGRVHRGGVSEGWYGGCRRGWVLGGRRRGGRSL